MSDTSCVYGSTDKGCPLPHIWGKRNLLATSFSTDNRRSLFHRETNYKIGSMIQDNPDRL
jgi:hypothetical protein